MKQPDMEIVGGTGIIGRDKGNFARLKTVSNSEKDVNGIPQGIVGHVESRASQLDAPLPANDNSGRYE